MGKKPAPGRTRFNDPEAMRRRVLDAAAEAFQSHGYHSTSTHDIMRAAGVTGGAFHHHFPSKKALAVAVIRERVAKAVAADLDRTRPIGADRSARYPGCLRAGRERPG